LNHAKETVYDKEHYRFCYKNSGRWYNFTVTADYNRLRSDRAFKVYPVKYGQEFAVNTFYVQVAKFLSKSYFSLGTSNNF